MTNGYWFYLKNIFVNPVKASRALLEETHLKRVIWISFAIGCMSYVIITLLTYHTIGWGDFPYRDYYPNYPSPYWWEVFVNPIWGAVITFGFGIPCYFLGKWLGGRGSWLQILSIILLSSIVSLPVFLIVDAYIVAACPALLEAFVKYGPAGFTPDLYPNEVFRFIHQTYVYVSMTWQGLVTLVGLTIVHQNKWYKNIPGIVAGNIIFVVFLLLIQDYMAIIW